MPEPMTVPKGRGERTAADLSSLLVELNRLYKGLVFYAPDHEARRELIDRAVLAWQVSLERAGSIELVLENCEIHCEGIEERIQIEHQAELLSALSSRGIQRLRFNPDLCHETFRRFAELLVDDRTATSEVDFEELLYAWGGQGIVVNGDAPQQPEAKAEPAPQKPGPTDPLIVAPTATEHAPSQLLDSPPTVPFITGPEGKQPLRTEARAMEPPPTVPIIIGPANAEPPPTVPIIIPAESVEPPRAEAGHPEPPRSAPRAAEPVPAAPATAACSIEENPFEAPASDETGERLRLDLRELDHCSDDTAYEVIARRISATLGKLAEDTRLDESYRVMLVLADHAAGVGHRPQSQMRAARATLEELADETLIVDLIDRSCQRERSKGVRPAQVLLQLDEVAASVMVERLDKEADSRSADEIFALIIAMGERAVPALARAISRRKSDDRAQRVVRLAGELQSPKLNSILADVLTEGGPALRKEAAKALVHIGNSEAINILIKALSSPLEDLPRTAALCLGVLGDTRAVEPILDTLTRTASGREPQLAEGMIRALGPFKDSADVIVPKLAAVLDQRSLVRRRNLRGPKLAALLALEGFGGSEAHQAISASTDDRDAAVCERAREILARLA